MNIYELFDARVIAANWTESANNRIPYLGEGLFPARKRSGLDLSWLKGSHGLPISLMPSAFDAKATFRDRIGVTKIETEMPFFREGFKIKERDRQDILRAQDSRDPYVQSVLSNIFDDAAQLIEGAKVVGERMRMQLLFPISGEMQIVIKANGVDYTYDFDAADAWKGTNYTALTGNAKWDAPSTADPFTTFKTAKDAIAAATGAVSRYAVMNTTTYNLLMSNAAIKNRYITKNGLSLGYLTAKEINAVIEDTVEITPIVYDKQYRNENKVAAKFVPDNYVALIPAGPLGYTNYGTTPEEADLLGSGDASVAIVDTGVAITTIRDTHPVNVNTYASEIILPSYENMDNVALIKVA